MTPEPESVVPERLRPHVRALETLLARMRRAGSTLLAFDGWDRWGSANASPEYRKQMEDEAGEAIAEKTAATRDLEALVAKLRAEEPEAVAAWADAHDAFLAAFIERDLSTRADPDTARFVADGERTAWAEVKRGERAYVDENVYYVSIDPARYKATFGVDP